MGEIQEFKPEKLVIGVLTSIARGNYELLPLLVSRFGPVDYQSSLLPFEFTDYYNDEMGSPITRFFVAFSRLISPEELSDVKIETNALESVFTEDGKRKINIDPGLLSYDRFTLASTKDNGRRIPLKKGIYAEVSLVFVNGEYKALEWTYPDFASSLYRSILLEIREIYRRQMKQ